MTGSERLAILAKGENPKLILRLRSGFAVMGDHQFLPGYCVLLAYPEVDHLTDLEPEMRVQYLSDLGYLGEAVMAVTHCRRVNYAILGNLDPFLHAHVWPRYEWEEPAYSVVPVTHYPSSILDAPEHAYDPEKHEELRSRIATHLAALVSL